MAKTLPILLAYLLSAFGWSMFAAGYTNYPLAGASAISASHVVRLAMYFLLLDINLYQKNFRKIHYFPQGIYEMFVASFFIDTALMCVWFPVERCMLRAAARPGPCVGPGRRCVGPRAMFSTLLQTSFAQIGIMISCYLLCFLFLFCVLHATRAVDFRLIRAAGFTYFLEDATRRLNKGIQKLSWYRCKSRDSLKSSSPTRGRGRRPRRRSNATKCY